MSGSKWHISYPIGDANYMAVLILVKEGIDGLS